MKKIISFVLVLALMLGMCSTFAFATEQGTPQYDAYFAFGDSMTRGVGTEEWIAPSNFSKAYDYSVRNVYGATGTNLNEAYPYIVSKAVDCDSPDSFVSYDIDDDVTYYPVAAAGLSLSSVMDLFGINFAEPDMEYDHNTSALHAYYRDLVPMFRTANTVLTGAGLENYKTLVADEWKGKINDTRLNNATAGAAIIGDISQLIKGATNPLVTLNLGLTDVILKPMQTMTDSDNILQAIMDEYNYWSMAYPMLINEIHRLNKNAEIVLVGFFNPYAEVTLANDTVMPIGDILNPIIAAMNLQCKQIADQFSFVKYADVSNAETPNRADGQSMLGMDLFVGDLADIAQLFDSSAFAMTNTWLTEDCLPGGDNYGLACTSYGAAFVDTGDFYQMTKVEYDNAADEIEGFRETVEMSTAYEYYGHLTADGNKYVARQILAALNEDFAEDYYNIVLDVERDEFINKMPARVSINGKEISLENCTVAGYKLKIKYDGSFATTLRVEYTHDGGQRSLFEYILVNEDGQYTATRVYGTNSVNEENQKLNKEVAAIADIVEKDVKPVVKELEKQAITAGYSIFCREETAAELAQDVMAVKQAVKDGYKEVGAALADAVAAADVALVTQSKNDLANAAIAAGTVVKEVVEASVERHVANRELLRDSIRAGVENISDGIVKFINGRR